MFKGIEGARGWLAWFVVLAHIVQETQLRAIPQLMKFGAIGGYSVLIFIVISGFVITHLIVEKRESYGIYIFRRFLRIYPAYLIALAYGAVIIFNFPSIETRYSLYGPQWHDMKEQVGFFWENPAAHVALHLSLLHGMVPNNIVQNSQYMFVSPAWSLSLEWQFYLVAPCFVYAVRKIPIIAAIAVVTAQLLFDVGVFGQFLDRSIIFGSAWYFLLGIGTRVFINRFPVFETYPFALAISLAFIAVIDRAQIALIAWICLILYIRSNNKCTLLDSKLALFMGARSYSIYILHLPIIWGASLLVYGPLSLDGSAAIAAVAGLTIIGVVLGAELTYRFVERPAINFGKSFGREPAPASQGW